MKDQERDVYCRTILELIKKGRVHYTDIEKKAVANMPTLRNIKHNQKTVLPLPASKWLFRTSQQRHIQNHTKRRKTLRNPELEFKISVSLFF